MGLRDTAEMLEACQADAAQLEREVADQRRWIIYLEQALADVRDAIGDPDELTGILDRVDTAVR